MSLSTHDDDDLIFPLPDDLEPEPASEPALTAELNEPQAAAALHTDGPLVVFAGAGSGKTRVITYRIANLVATHRVPPYRILAVTFTNKAATEMKRRLEGLIGADVVRDLWVGTFHAVCARLLRTFHEAAGLGRNFTIYDDADQKAVVGRVLKELELDDKRYPPRQVLSRIHKEKQEGRTAADFHADSWLDEAIGKCFEGYERHLRAANAVDFDDLLLSVLRVAEDEKSQAGAELRRKFRYVLVDEFQDTNQVQYRLVRALASSTKNLCVVGDDDQSIYRWRGADVRNIRGFRRDFPDANIVKLEENYRSTANVVAAALGVIRFAADREPKELWTSNAPGDPVAVVATQSERDEAAWIARRIHETVERGVSPRDIAVFYRIHAQSRVLEEVMRHERIPYQIIGGMRFFERAEIKDFLAYLRLVANPDSDVDLGRVINVPSRKIGQTTIDRLVAMADARGCSLFDAIEPLVASGQAKTANRSLVAFRTLVAELAVEAKTASPRLLAEEVLERTGYTQHLAQQDSAEADARLQNLEELVGSIAEYEEEAANAGETATVQGYLERVTLSSDQDGLEDAPKVAMMTVHAAKGLEFDTVFLTGMEEEMFPYRGLDPEHADELEEERRLAYVAITRARRMLAITHAETRTLFGRTRYGIPSRFLGDLPPAVVKPMKSAAMRQTAPRMGVGAVAADRPRGPWTHPQAGALAFGGRMSQGAPPPRPAEPARAPGERYVEREWTPSDEGMSGELRSGARVVHAKYGAGVVQSIDAGPDPIVTVRFSSGWGTKRIKASFLRAG